ncbi:hypothetical protein [Candidatus Xianfuyuplasma coldseepsis]|uniref:Uncharacterized protein n=1 Tax=Candidatus Xianfuyuplasma coldseepsis TaxID=2782163 RepID=A0A7L7KNV6_9MOLU|nr:hypothetical protein [Xianfuyuplasma coldseepsis]QMS84205.1 hypothetical protein G4Z02_00095 [Xianfuyuplasma coldseepsis]
MKRLLLLFTTLLAMIALSACDFFTPDVVEELSEEYCRENPSSEICTGDAVGELTTEYIINIFNTILNEYNDATNTTFCDDYFSLSNLTLLDSCRANRDGLFPEDVSSYTILSVDSVLDFGTQDEYEMVVASPDGLTQYTFTIGLTKLDGDILLQEWSYVQDPVDPTTIAVIMEVAIPYFEQFIDDYTNDNIQSSTVCQTYFPDQELNDCEAERDEAIAANLTATIIRFDEVAEGFSVTLSLTDDSGSKTEVLLLTFAYDSNANIIMTWPEDNGMSDEETCRENPDDPICTGAEANMNTEDLLTLFQQAAIDFDDETITDFCDVYFGISNIPLLDECRADRTSLFPTDISTYDIDSITVVGTDLYEIDVVNPAQPLTHYVFKVGVTSIQSTVVFDEWSYVIETIDPATLTVPLEDAELYFIGFIDAYTNGNLDSESVCSNYLGSMDQTECTEQRDNDLLNELTVELLDFVPVDDVVHVTMKMTSIEGVKDQTIIVKFYYDFGLFIQMDILGDLYNLDYDTLWNFTVDLFNDFFFSTIPAETVCMTYFDEDQYEFCMEGYAEKEASGYTQTPINLEEYDDHYLITLETWSEGQLQHTMTIQAWFFYVGNELKIHIDPESGNNSDYEFYHNFFKQMILDYHTTSIDDETFCSTYFEAEHYDMCVSDRSQDDFDYEWSIELFEQLMNPNEFHVILYWDNGSDNYTEDLLVTFYDVDGHTKIKMDGFTNDDYTYYYDLMQTFIAQWNDEYNTSEWVCTTFMAGESYQGCMDNREQFRPLGYTISILQFEAPYDNHSWMTSLLYDNGDDSFVLHAEIYFVELSGETFIDFVNVWIEDERIDQLFINFINDFNNDTIDDETLCTSYFRFEEDKQKCYDMRAGDLGETFVRLDHIEALEPGFFALHLTLEYMGNTWNETWLFMTFEEDGQWFLTFEDDPYHEDIIALFTMYVEELMNPDIPDDEFCHKYFSMEEATQCITQRTAFDYSYVVEISYMMQVDEMNLQVQLHFYNNDNDYFEDFFVQFYYDENNELSMHFMPLDDTYEQDLQFFNQMITDYHNMDFTNEEFCSMYFEADLYTQCINDRSNDDFTYALTIQQFAPLMGDREYHAILYWDNGVDSYTEDLRIIFYIVEGSTKIIMEPFNNNPDIGSFIEGFMQQLLDSSISDDAFCNAFFIDSTDPQCYDLRNAYINGFWIDWYEFYPHNEYWVMTIGFTDGFDYFDEEFAFVVEPQHDGSYRLKFIDATIIDFDAIWNRLYEFVDDFNDYSMITDDIAAIYLVPNTSFDIINLREMTRENNIYINYYSLFEEYGNYSIQLDFDDGTSYRYTLYVHEMNGHLFFELFEDFSGIDITEGDVSGVAYSIFWDLANGYTIDDICNNYFAYHQHEMCATMLSGFQSSDITVEVSNVWFNVDHFEIELRYIYSDMTEEYYYWNVYAFYDSDDLLKLEFTEDDYIPREDKDIFMQNFITDFNDNSFDADVLCNLYMAPDSYDLCTEIYTTLSTNNYMLNWYTYDLWNEPNWVEFGVYDSTYQMIHYFFYVQVEFRLDEFNNMTISLWDYTEYQRVSEAQAIAAIDGIFAALHDLTITDDEFCNEWGYIFNDCYGLRQLIRDEGGTLLRGETNVEDELQYYVQATLTTNSYTEEYYFHFYVKSDLQGFVYVDGYQEDHSYMVPLSVATEFITAFFTDYLDPSILEPDFIALYNDNYWVPGVEDRQRYLDQGYGITVTDVRLALYDGYYIFEADLAVFNGTDTYYYTMPIDVYYKDNNELAIGPRMDYLSAGTDYMTTLAQGFYDGLLDDTVDDITFCTDLFGPDGEYPCADIRRQLIDSNYTLDLVDISADDYNAMLIIDVYSGTNLVTTFDWTIYSYSTLLGEMKFHLEIWSDEIAAESLALWVEQFTTTYAVGYSITDICALDNIDCNGIWIDEGQVIDSIYFQEFYHNYEDVLGLEFELNIMFFYTDGSEQSIGFNVTYAVNENGVYTWYFVVERLKAPLPDDAMALPLTVVEVVLDQFMLDIKDGSIDARTFCDTYFGGNFENPDCLEGRPEIILTNPTITRSDIGTTVIDNVTYYTVTFYIDNGVNVEEQFVTLRIFQIAENQFFIQFYDDMPNNM